MNIKPPKTRKKKFHLRRFNRKNRTGSSLSEGSSYNDENGTSSSRHNLIILPNLFTAGSLFLSLFAIVQVSNGDFIGACWLIIYAAICDAVDGPIARLTKTQSDFGLQFDSLADVVAFGVAPAFLMYANLKRMDETLFLSFAPRLALGACALYAICSAIRLARFNVQAETAERKHFCGLPTPGAAGLVVAAFLFVDWLTQLPFLQEGANASWYAQNLYRLTLVITIGTALLMVSEIPFPKLRNMLTLSMNPIRTLVYLVGVICLIIVFQDVFPVLLFGGFLLYVFGAIYMNLRGKTSITQEPLKTH